MIVNFVYNDRLQSIILPSKVNGQYNFLNDSKKTVFRIEGIDGKWIIKTTSMFEIREENSDSLEVEPKKLYSFKNKANNTDRIYLFTEEYTSDRIKFFLVSIPNVISISIGKEAKSITYDNDYVSSSHAILQYSNGNWSISDSSKNGTFVNGVKIQSGNLKYGDMIFVMGMKIILGKGCFSINNPDKKVKFLSSDFKGYVVQEIGEVVEDDDDLEPVFFDRSPRFKRDIEPAEIQIDSPPRDNNDEEMPIMLTVGPALTMAMASMTTGAFAVTNAISSGNITSAIPTVVMSGSMCLGTLLWPTLTRRYTKKQKAVKENLRRAKYNEYLEMRRIDISSICDEQSQILHENNISISECEARIMQIQRNLWERSIGQNDFLSFRIGIGNLPMFGHIQYNQIRFSLSEDVLEDKMFKLCEEPKVLKNVPISISLLDESIAIIGDKMAIHEFAKGLIIQLATLYSYDEVKLVVLYDSDDEQNFGFVKWLPHVWNKEKNLRLVASIAEEVKSVSAHLENVTSYRNSMNDTDLADESPYYVIFALSKSQFNRAEVLKTVLGSKKKIHISIVSVFPELRMLPKECAKVVELAGTEGRLFDKNDTAGNVTIFRPDISLNRSALELSTQLANIQLDDSDQSSKLPKMITFLQMMNVGKVEHLRACSVSFFAHLIGKICRLNVRKKILNRLLEFQTAHLSDAESTFDVVKAKCAELSRCWKGTVAEKIPILPSVVDAEFLLPYVNDNEPYNLPIGVNKNTLMVQKYNFENHFANLVLSSGDDRIKFLTELLNLVVRIPTLKITVFDPEENLFFDELLFPADRFKHLNNIELCNATASWCYDEMVNRHKMCKASLEANAETPNLEYHLFIVVSMKSLINGLEDDSYKRLEAVLENGNPMYRFNFIISDESKNVSSYSFNTWYKKHVLGNSGIWCGNGVSEQYSIKATTTTSAMRQAIESSLGYVFIDGGAMLCKMMSEGDENANGT